MKKGILKPGFLKKSVGPSNRIELGSFGWNNLSRATSKAVTCQACLKKWPARGHAAPRTISVFLGLEIVEECCGALLDQVYRESGAVFTIHKLLEVLGDPKNHPMLVASLRELIPKLHDATISHTIWEGLQK